MNNQTPLINNRNESNSPPEQKIPNPVNILSFLEEGNLQKRFFRANHDGRISEKEKDVENGIAPINLVKNIGHRVTM
jgi:hypothetical protein